MNQTEHAETTVYLSLDASTMVASKQVHIEDIASVFCSQPDIMHDVKKIKLFTFRDNEQGQLVVNALAIIGEILKYDKSVTVQNIGSQECVVYYRNLCWNCLLSQSRISDAARLFRNRLFDHVLQRGRRCH